MKRRRIGENVPPVRLIASVMCVLVIGAVMACQPAQNDGPPKEGVAAFYDGRVIRWIIPYSPGGGYDEYGRMIAPYLEKYTGARVDIVNLPGAGGMRGVNELFHARNDGLTIGMMNGSALVTNELAGMRGADYKIGEFEYLGRVVADARVFVIALESGYGSFEEIWQLGQAVKIGATGLGGSMLRGNIVGTWGSWGSAAESVDQGRDKVVLQSGAQRAPDLTDVPTVYEMAEKLDDPERAIGILNAWESMQAVGRPVAVPPGTDVDKVQFLSEALANALNDPELRDFANKTGRPIHHLSAEEMRQIVNEAMVMPDDVRELFVRAIRGEL
jgi:tripartite-type tricarboxylate transporter receptor subunit TctC